MVLLFGLGLMVVCCARPLARWVLLAAPTLNGADDHHPATAYLALIGAIAIHGVLLTGIATWLWVVSAG